MVVQKIARREINHPATVDGMVEALHSMEEIRSTDVVGILTMNVVTYATRSMLEVKYNAVEPDASA